MSDQEPSMDLEALKSQAARVALQHVASGMLLGLGTGSTVAWFLKHLAQALADGILEDLRGVPTSLRTRSQCRELGIPLISLADQPELDLAVDGADEVAPNLDLIKGLGAALLREKMVASSARRLVVISDHTKLVPRLGTRAPLPIEVVPFAWRSHLPFLRSLGGDPARRCLPDGSALLTDNGNHILDCRFEQGIPAAAELDRRLLARPGIVDHGLFLGMASTGVIATPSGVQILGEGPGHKLEPA